MARILILFGHPALEKSRVQATLLRSAMDLEDVRIHDLYEAYPDYDIDVRREQHLLLQHDIIIWQHPFYWYSAPAIIKQWQDLVLEHGWAYGSGGNHLQGKTIMNVISCGGSRASYSREGRNRFTIRELLSPFEQTAHLCNMNYMQPFVVHGTHKLSRAEIESFGENYREMLVALRNGRLQSDEVEQPYINDLISLPQTIQS